MLKQLTRYLNVEYIERALVEHVERGLVDRRLWVRVLTILGICLAAGLPIGAIIGLLGGLYGTAFLLAMIAAYLMLKSLLFGLVVLIGVIVLLPFAALPFDIGFSPTFLDLVLLAIFFVWLSRIVTHEQIEFSAVAPTGGVLAFCVLAVFSFVAGLGHAPLTANVLRHFLEILLSLLIFLLVINSVTTRKQLELLVTILILAGAASALAGIVLYFLPEALTVRLLSVLRIVRYPSGSDVLRYIEDDPEQALRATSTSIDPNVLGGMLIFVTTMTAAQLMAEEPILPRWLLAPVLLGMVVCMLLTYSRGSFVGLMAALFVLGLLRYRRILLIAGAILVVMLFLPITQNYVQHFIEGVRGEDLATQMRFGEYKDALIVISRHPILGVGFSGTPYIDTYLGVSSVYLLIAEETGLMGLSAFLITMIIFALRFLSVQKKARQYPDLDPLLLGTCLAVLGGMVGGVFDHYLFNLDFPHASTLLWLTVGLGTVAIELVQKRAGPAER